MKIKTYFINILKLVFPSKKWEWIVFAAALTCYSSFAYSIAKNFRIVFDDRIPWDAYFSFDNRAIVMTGGGFERHPLSNYFFNWIREFALWITDGKMNADFRIVLALCSSFIVSLSIVQVFKYLQNIIKLPLWLSLLIVTFFGLFTTNILLSFTPENYTYTLFLLCLFNYYVAKQYQADKTLSFGAVTFFGVTVGGLTITNIVKVYLPMLFQPKLYWNWKKIGLEISKVLVSISVFALLFLNRINFNIQNFFIKTEEQYDKFSNPKVTPLWDMIYSWFFGGNMLFPSFVLRDYHNKKGFEYKAIFMDVYSSFWSYLVVGLIVAFVIWSFVKNFKNRLVQILFWSLFIDVVIHCVLKFGLHTSYIYGGHFVFVFPLLIGWLFFAYRKNSILISSLTTSLVLITVYLGINNFVRLDEFIEFLNVYYK